MKKITKLFACVALVLLMCITLTGCSLNPFSVAGKTYNNAEFSYKLSEDGKEFVDNYCGGDVEIIISQKEIERFKDIELEFVFNEGGSCYLIFEGQRIDGTWKETSDEVLFSTTDNEQMIMKKGFSTISIDLKPFIKSMNLFNCFDKIEIILYTKIF